MTRKLTLVFTITILTIVALFGFSAEASQISNHARMIRKRQLGGNGAAPSVGVIGAAPDPDQPSLPATADPTDTALPTEKPSASAATTAAGQQTTPGGLGLSLTIPPLGGSASVSHSINSASASASTNSSTSTSTSSTQSSTSVATTPIASSATSDAVVTVTSTSSSSAAESSTAAADSSGASSNNSQSHIARNTVVSIAVVAACIIGAGIIWTVIRKWKFSPSDEFDSRLNPIDWQPTNIEPEMAQHKRTNSGGSHRSFGNLSGDIHSSGSHDGMPGPNNMISDLPNHDFTAGPSRAGLAPVGGYMDMHRGPSPVPTMNSYGATGYGATQYNRGGY